MSTTTNPEPNFPLTEKANRAGVFDLKEGFVISAPTATGKSRIGMEVMKKFCATKYSMEMGMYIVPFKALADEVYLQLKEMLPERKIAIKTGDYDVEPNLSELDVVVATYESAEGLLRKGENVVWPRVVVADEISYISDPNRGVRIEGLLSYLAGRKQVKIYGLSAVLKEPQKVANWLGSNSQIKLLSGTEADRPSRLEVLLKTYSEGSKDEVVKRLVKEWLPKGNVIVFCDTKPGTRKLSDSLKDLVWETLTPDERARAGRFANQLKIDFPYLVDMPEQVSKGVAYHNADLEPEVRKLLAHGFYNKTIKLICATTTLSAGINLPARTVIVRDVRRWTRKLLPVSEVVNMLGRAGRPKLDSLGTGIYLMESGYQQREDEKEFVRRVQSREVEELTSALPSSTTNLMTFILATIARTGHLTRVELLSNFKSTFWVINSKVQIPDRIPAKSEMATILSGYSDEEANLDLRSCEFRNGVLTGRGGSKSYEISFAETSMYCSCPGYLHYNRCKHLGRLAYEVLGGSLGNKYPGAKPIVLVHLDKLVEPSPVYRIVNALWLLLEYGFVEEIKDEETSENILTLSRDGTQALVSYLLSMSHVRRLRDRIREVRVNPKNSGDVIRWALEDLSAPPEAEQEEDESVERALEKFKGELYPFMKYLNGTYYRDAYQSFSNLIRPYLLAKDRLTQILNAYLAFCPVENIELKETILVAKRRIQYGCPEAYLPVAILNFEEIRRPEMIKALNQNGVTNVWDLARCDSATLIGSLGLLPTDASKLIERAVRTAELLRDFPIDKPGLLRLSQRSGISVEDLLSYCRPS